MFRCKGNRLCYTCIYDDTIQAVPLRMTRNYMTALLFLWGTENVL